MLSLLSLRAARSEPGGSRSSGDAGARGWARLRSRCPASDALVQPAAGSAAKGSAGVTSRSLLTVSRSGKVHGKRRAGQRGEAGGAEPGEMAGRALAACPVSSAPGRGGSSRGLCGTWHRDCHVPPAWQRLARPPPAPVMPAALAALPSRCRCVPADPQGGGHV